MTSVPLNCINLLKGLPFSPSGPSSQSFTREPFKMQNGSQHSPSIVSYYPQKNVKVPQCGNQGPWWYDHCLVLQIHFPPHSPSFPFNIITLLPCKHHGTSPFVPCAVYFFKMWCTLKSASHSLWNLLWFSTCSICPSPDISMPRKNQHPITSYSILHICIFYMLPLFHIFTCIIC